jgi:cytidyltransferase-like protein
VVKRGLTLGKYVPLHRGHQLVIETALAEMDETIVLIYDAPDVTDVPLATRSGWLRSLYPSAREIEAWSGPAARLNHKSHLLAVNSMPCCSIRRNLKYMHREAILICITRCKEGP